MSYTKLDLLQDLADMGLTGQSCIVLLSETRNENISPALQAGAD